jgi:hypothetical protein
LNKENVSLRFTQGYGIELGGHKRGNIERTHDIEPGGGTFHTGPSRL